MPVSFTTARPLTEAVAALGRRTPLGSRLDSAGWQLVAPEIRDRAFFSATVEDERMLVAMQAKIQQRIDLATQSPSGVTMDRSRFIAETQDDLRALGYVPDPAKAGTLQDISSAGRLGLIWDMQVKMAEGFARWKSGMDADLLDAAPAMELVRIEERVEKRDWPQIWRDNGGEFYGTENPDYPDATGRMIALKTSGIWSAISRFGTPWPPFDWGSGMGTRDVRRAEAEQFGLLSPNQTLTPLDTPFNSGLSASTRGLTEPSLDRLRSALGDAAEIDPATETVRWIRPAAVETVDDSLRVRSQEAVATGRAAGEDRAEILASMAAVATGRRALVTFAGEHVLDWLPGVDHRVVAGRTYIWRADRITAEITALINGSPWLAGETVPLEIITGNGTRAALLQIPREGAASFARTRLRDYVLALGPGYRAILAGEEVARG
jgi:hypothetical protein